MFHRLVAMICVGLLIVFSVCAEETNKLVSCVVTNGAKQAAFLYPDYCYIEDDDTLGVFVYLNDTDYVAISIPNRGLSGTEKLRENIGDDASIHVLTDDMNVFATHGDDNHHRPNVDIVAVGIDLPDGTGIIANAECNNGTTEIYDVLLTIVDSFTDASTLETWLADEWIPNVLQNP